MRWWDGSTTFLLGSNQRSRSLTSSFYCFVVTYNETITTTESAMPKLTLRQANKIIEAGFARGREMKVKPIGIVVLDDAGHIVSAQREDGASMFRLDVAKGKAWAAV